MTDGKWMFILWRRNDIKTKRESTSFKAKEYAQHIKLLKDFTREELARYLTLVKEEKENGSFPFILFGLSFVRMWGGKVDGKDNCLF